VWDYVFAELCVLVIIATPRASVVECVTAVRDPVLPLGSSKEGIGYS